MFAICDELHAAVQGTYATEAEALAELKRRSRVPWNEEPNGITHVTLSGAVVITRSVQNRTPGRMRPTKYQNPHSGLMVSWVKRNHAQAAFLAEPKPVDRMQEGKSASVLCKFVHPGKMAEQSPTLGDGY
jgi:hypothetical protein